MGRLSTYLLLFLLLVAGQAWAGVVEDAEEELKKMGRGQQRSVIPSVDRNAASERNRSVRSGTRESRSDSSSDGGKDRSKQAATEKHSRSGSVSKPSAQPDPGMPRGRAKMDREKRKKGRLVSAGVVLFLALLIFLATVTSRRLGRSE